MSTGQAAIDAALAHGDPREVTERVKEAVAREVSEINPKIEVRKTQYFNHSYAPDLVAWWGSSQSEHREIFLRFDAADPHIAADIERLDHDHPMFFSLRSRSADETPPEVTEALSRHRQVMVTGADALDAISDSPAQSFESFVSTAILQAGRGLLDEEQAYRARRDTRSGLEAALLVDEDGTGRAIPAAREVLMDAASQRVEKYLQMLWLAGGGEIERYPGSLDLSLDIGSEDVEGLIRLILRSKVTDDPEYWRRLGSMISLEVLERLGSVEPNTNLQLLLSLNAHRLQVRYAAATKHDPRLSGASGDLQWFVSKSKVCLDGPEWTIIFADDGRHFRGVSKDQRLPHIDEVARRAERFAIESLGLDDENLMITVEPKIVGGAAQEVRMIELVDAIGGSPRVRTVTVRMGASVTIEFDRLVAGIERGFVGLPLLAEVGAALMTNAADTELQLLRRQLGAEDSWSEAIDE